MTTSDVNKSHKWSEHDGDQVCGQSPWRGPAWVTPELIESTIRVWRFVEAFVVTDQATEGSYPCKALFTTH